MDLSNKTPIIFMSNDVPYYGSLLTLRALEIDIAKIVCFVNNDSASQKLGKCGLQMYFLTFSDEK